MSLSAEKAEHDNRRNAEFFTLGEVMVAVSRILIRLYSRNTLKNRCSALVPIRRMRATKKYTGLDSDCDKSECDCRELVYEVPLKHIAYPDVFNV
jgi:hypothetical protein